MSQLRGDSNPFTAASAPDIVAHLISSETMAGFVCNGWICLLSINPTNKKPAVLQSDLSITARF
jgi:hypothetical protein